jgi:multidrug efflux pump subunit AcrB
VCACRLTNKQTNKVYKGCFPFVGASLTIMFLTLQDLKVDQTFIPSEDSGILVTNINVPESEFVNIDSVLERIRNLIVNDYYNVDNVQFQVCATYELRNTETGDVRKWTGSFNPRGNSSNALSAFQIFTPNFKEVVKNALKPDNVHRKLGFHHAQTNWVFQRLTSIIIAVQSEVNLTHPTLLRRSLLIQRNGRRNRTIQSFLLP